MTTGCSVSLMPYEGRADLMLLTHIRLAKVESIYVAFN